MKHMMFFVFVVLFGSLQMAQGASKTINSTTDKNGNQHPGTTAVKGPATITCLTANPPQNPPATCYVEGPGVAKQVRVGANVGTSGAGTVTLTCNGTAPLNCSARVVD